MLVLFISLSGFLIYHTVSKIASGAAEVIPVIKVVNLSRVLNQLKEKNFWISGFDGDGTKNLYEHKFDSLNVLVMGAEGSGLRNSTKKNCDFLLKIPMLGSVSSLNVSVATGIALYEVVRQNKTWFYFSIIYYSTFEKPV